MEARTARNWAVVGAAAVLAVGSGSVGYAAGQITGADIQNNSVTTADIQNGSLRVNDLSTGAQAALTQSPPAYTTSADGDMTLTGSPSEPLNLELPGGSYVVYLGGTASSTGDTAVQAQCGVEAGGASTQVPITAPADGLSNPVVAQVPVTLQAAGFVLVSCSGSGAVLKDLSMTAITVGQVTTQ